MKTTTRESIAIFLAGLLLLSSFTTPATACCEPPAPPCHRCEAGVWVWDCAASQNCCGGSCCSNTCCNGTCCSSGQNCCGGFCCSNACCSGVFCCDPGEVCCNGGCSECQQDSDCGPPACWNCEFCKCKDQCNPSNCETCVDGSCKVCEGDPNQECCAGTCCDTSKCECVDGECLCCFTLEDLPLSEEDNCSCTGGDCSGSFVRKQYHNCKHSASGYTGCKQFDNVQVGWYWECTESESPNWCGVLACAALNAGVCFLLCNAAVVACSAMCTGTGGAPECASAAQDCLDCLTGNGIDCGCLTVTCIYPDDPTGKIFDSDKRLYGETCP